MVDKQLDQTGKIQDESCFVLLLAERLMEEALEEADDLHLAVECKQELLEQIVYNGGVEMVFSNGKVIIERMEEK